MNQEKMAALTECARQSTDGTITFGAAVGRLMQMGVERYHADYTRDERTYYMPDGESLVFSAGHREPIAETFSPGEIESALRCVQRKEIGYGDFVKQTAAAGCVGYVVCITGRKALYFGRQGEIYVEPFPAGLGK